VNDKQHAYGLILQRSIEAFTGTHYAFYVYTDADPPFERVHVTGDVGAMLDFVRAYVREDVLYELEDNPFFWDDLSPEVAQIADLELCAFTHYASGGIMAPLYTLDAAYYLRDVLADKPGWRFVIGWEAQPPLHDLAYCILEQEKR
jgi:hypothetical protein